MLKYIGNGVKGLVRGWRGAQQKAYNVLDDLIVFPPDYYEPTLDLKTNLEKFAQALKKIDVKYLSDLPRDKGRIESINDEIELAKINVHLRAGNYSVELLKKGEALEKRYGSFERAAKLKEMYLDLEYNQKKSQESKSVAEWCIANEILEDIKHNIEPGQFPKSEGPMVEWREMVDLLGNKLRKRNLDLAGQDYNQEIRDIWDGIRQEVQGEMPKVSSLGEKITQLAEIKKSGDGHITAIDSPDIDER